MANELTTRAAFPAASRWEETFGFGRTFQLRDARGHFPHELREDGRKKQKAAADCHRRDGIVVQKRAHDFVEGDALALLVRKISPIAPGAGSSLANSV